MLSKFSGLKAVGILNLLNDDLLATEQSITCALAGEDLALRGKVKSAIEKLRTVKRAIYDRGRAHGLCLWPHTSVDLEKAYEDARRDIGTPRRVASSITDYLETRPIRRPARTTSKPETSAITRFGYYPVTDLPALLHEPLTTADGQ